MCHTKTSIFTCGHAYPSFRPCALAGAEVHPHRQERRKAPGECVRCYREKKVVVGAVVKEGGKKEEGKKEEGKKGEEERAGVAAAAAQTLAATESAQKESTVSYAASTSIKSEPTQAAPTPLPSLPAPTPAPIAGFGQRIVLNFATAPLVKLPAKPSTKPITTTTTQAQPARPKTQVVRLNGQFVIGSAEKTRASLAQKAAQKKAQQQQPTAAAAAVLQKPVQGERVEYILKEKVKKSKAEKGKGKSTTASKA